MKKPYYFTYSTDGNQDHQGGHIIIHANDESEARVRYEELYGKNDSGFLKFAFQYSEELWNEIDDHGFNKHCHHEYDKEGEDHE
jgi:hypothetical protein